MTRKFISLNDYAKLHNVSYVCINYRIKKRYVPRAQWKYIKGKFFNTPVKAIRSDYKMIFTKKTRRKEPTYSDREWQHTVFLPGGIKKVLEPHEYKNNRFKKFSTVA